MRTTTTIPPTLRTSPARRTRLALLIPFALTAVVAAGCGSGSPDTGAEEPSTAPSSPSSPAGSPGSDPSAPPPTSAAPTDQPVDLEITVAGDEITPNAVDLTSDAGQALTFVIEADRAGELHVHAKPEQYLDFEAGTTTVELVVDTPGSVEIEEHETGAVVALLEVR